MPLPITAMFKDWLESGRISCPPIVLLKGLSFASRTDNIYAAADRMDHKDRDPIRARLRNKGK